MISLFNFFVINFPSHLSKGRSYRWLLKKRPPSAALGTLVASQALPGYRSHLGMDGIEDGGGIHPSSVRDELGASGMDLGELGQVVGLPVEAEFDVGEKRGPWGSRLPSGNLT